MRWRWQKKLLKSLIRIMSASEGHKKTGSVLLGAAFLMATSAIGPGFITQTTVFTQQLLTSFGFVILWSVLIDIAVQLNIWRIVSVSGLRAQDLTNRFFPGTGYVLALLVGIGGLAFNIGNVAGAGLGIEVMTDIDMRYGVIISVLISIFIFWYRDAGKAMDWFTKILGIVMILLTAYIAIRSSPPVVKALQHSFVPEVIDTTAIIVLVGGTVGGYISFAGVHRLIDAGISGPAHITQVSANSVKGILITTAMRILLFLAALGVVYGGTMLDLSNPAASVFEQASGKIGYRVFGVVLWCASITSVVGSAFTSVSFFKTFHPIFERNHRTIVTIFILVSACGFLIIGRPVKILVIVGALNAFILPLALLLLLLVAQKMKKQINYQHPLWLTITGWIAMVGLFALSVKTIAFDLLKLWR
jgi:Mn2+/Fe2+ NRAMP family transporter